MRGGGGFDIKRTLTAFEGQREAASVGRDRRAKVSLEDQSVISSTEDKDVLSSTPPDSIQLY